MNSGYLFMLLGLLSFATMGIFHKLADRYHADALRVTLFTMGFAALFATLSALWGTSGHLLNVQSRVALLAIPFGVCASAGFWFFQRGLRFGKISTSWLVINLSSATPTLLSILIYREPVSPRKGLALAFVTLSLILLWWDRRQEQPVNDAPKLNGVPVSIGEGD
jgi:drug/metabolite transporter (DMT)-like permease